MADLITNDVIPQSSSPPEVLLSTESINEEECSVDGNLEAEAQWVDYSPQDQVSSSSADPVNNIPVTEEEEVPQEVEEMSVDSDKNSDDNVEIPSQKSGKESEDSVAGEDLKDGDTQEEEQQQSPQSILKADDDSKDDIKKIIANNVEDIISKEGGDVLASVANLKTMKTEDVENLILNKIIESINSHSTIGILHKKLLEAQMQRDKLVGRVTSLQRQVIDLTKAVRSMSENVGRQNSANNSAATASVQPLKFYRSVGLQASYDSSSNISSSINSRSGNENIDIVKSRIHSHSNNVNGVVPPAPPLLPLGNANPNLKRTLNTNNVHGTRPMISVAELTKQVELENQQSKVRRLNPSSLNNSPNKINEQVKINNSSPKLIRNPIGNSVTIANVTNTFNKSVAATNNKNNGVEPGVVDLTDDSEVTTSRSVVNSINLLPKSIAAIPISTANGQPTKVQLVQVPPGMQLVSALGQRPQQVLLTNAPTTTTGTTTKIISGKPPPARILPNSISGGQQSLLLRSVPVIVNQQNGTSTPLISSNQLIIRPTTSSTTVTTSTVNKAQLQSSTAAVTSNAIPIKLAPHVQVVRPSTAAVSTTVSTVASSQNINRTTPQATVQPNVKKFVLPPLPAPSVQGEPKRCPKDIPPRPELTLQQQKEGIVLTWTLKLGGNHADIQTYQIYACQEPLTQNPQGKPASWKRVGDVKALPLPMACTLSQFAEENRYHFIVRGVDTYNRTGPFCEVMAITLKSNFFKQ